MSGQCEREKTNLEGATRKTSDARSTSMATPTVTFYLKSAPVYKYQDPFEHYHFSSVAGRGGCATVYEVQHIASGEQYACKVVHTQGSKDRVQQALKEACMQVALSDHHNVASLKEVWVSGAEHVFLFMEKCEGGEVFDAIASRGALPESEAACVLRVVLQLVYYCHERGIVHHDLKPENFMLKDSQQGLTRSNIRAIDFGAAAFADDTSVIPSGTPQYAAPEIILGMPHDHRADVWSAGVFLYCMLSGLAPFNGDDHHEQKLAVLQQEIDFEEDPWPFVSDEAKDLCQRLLQRKPADRLSLEEALHHPWMEGVFLEDIPSDTVLDRLHAFCHMGATQQSLMLEYSKSHADNTQAHQTMFNLFEWMDLNGDGIISMTDFKQGMLRVFDQLHDSFLEEVFQALAQSGEKSVTWPEFLAAVIDRQSPGDQPPSMSSAPIASTQRSQSPQELQQRETQEAWQACWEWQESIPDPTLADDRNEVSHEQLNDMWHASQFCSSTGHQSVRGTSPVRRGSVRGRSPVRGCSPNTESSWDRMIQVRGGSPATVGLDGSAAGASPRISMNKEHSQSDNWNSKALPRIDEQMRKSSEFEQQDSLDSSFENYVERGLEGAQHGFSDREHHGQSFSSGGVTYWYSEKQGRTGANESGLIDSDSMYGPALAAYEARQREDFQ